MARLVKGEVPYGSYSIEEADITYSIDRCMIDVQFAYRSGLFEQLCLTTQVYQVRCGARSWVSHLFDVEKHIWQFDHVHVEIFQKGRFVYLPHVDRHSGESHMVKVAENPLPVVRVDFNPNKVSSDMPFLAAFWGFLRTCDEKGYRYGWTVKRVDYAADISCPVDSVYVLSRKAENYYRSSRYYGVKGSNGMLRVYDKAAELADKDHIDIGKDLTRLEWVQIGNVDFDFIFDKAAFFDPSQLGGGSSKLLKYIPPDRFNSALFELDPKTRRKIKDNCFREIPIKHDLFRLLLDRMWYDIGIPITNRMKKESETGIDSYPSEENSVFVQKDI